MNHPIITSLLDTDFYKITMMNAIFNGSYNNLNYTDLWVRYKFQWRNFDKMKLGIPLDYFKALIDEQIDNLCQLRFSEDEIKYLESIPFIGRFRGFIEYLRLFKLNRDHIRTYIENNQLGISIEGPWLNTILFEVPVLAIISELYTNYQNESSIVHGTLGTYEVSHNLVYTDFKYVDFGTRRRATKERHKNIINSHLTRFPDNFMGTSNVLFSKEYGMTPKGTMAHEWIQAHQQIGPRLIDSQSQALQAWANVYRGDLGIALSDTITFDAFLKDFDRYFGMLFDGVRHDSGDPFIWCQKLINHYGNLKIDPRTKFAIFSNSLDFDTIGRINEYFNHIINTSFGIGTNLTNNGNITPPNIVIKMVECNGLPVAKISDDKGKGMCQNSSFLDYLEGIISHKTNRS